MIKYFDCTSESFGGFLAPASYIRVLLGHAPLRQEQIINPNDSHLFPATIDRLESQQPAATVGETLQVQYMWDLLWLYLFGSIIVLPTGQHRKRSSPKPQPDAREKYEFTAMKEEFFQGLQSGGQWRNMCHISISDPQDQAVTAAFAALNRPANYQPVTFVPLARPSKYNLRFGDEDSQGLSGVQGSQRGTSANFSVIFA